MRPSDLLCPRLELDGGIISDPCCPDVLEPFRCIRIKHQGVIIGISVCYEYLPPRVPTHAKGLKGVPCIRRINVRVTDDHGHQTCESSLVGKGGVGKPQRLIRSQGIYVTWYQSACGVYVVCRPAVIDIYA